MCYHEALNEIVRIINKNYYGNNAQFKKILLTALKNKTGNNKLNIICSHVINQKK